MSRVIGSGHRTVVRSGKDRCVSFLLACFHAVIKAGWYCRAPASFSQDWQHAVAHSDAETKSFTTEPSLFEHGGRCQAGTHSWSAHWWGPLPVYASAHMYLYHFYFERLAEESNIVYFYKNTVQNYKIRFSCCRVIASDHRSSVLHQILHRLIWTMETVDLHYFLFATCIL